MTLIAPTLEAFFTERLAGQRKASPHEPLTRCSRSLKMTM